MGRFPQCPGTLSVINLRRWSCCACGVLTGSLSVKWRAIPACLCRTRWERQLNPVEKAAAVLQLCRTNAIPRPAYLTLAGSASGARVGRFFSFRNAARARTRGVGGWQAEWPIVAGVIQSTGVAIASMAEVAEGLCCRRVEDAPQHRGIHEWRQFLHGERAMMPLGAKLGRDVGW